PGAGPPSPPPPPGGFGERAETASSGTPFVQRIAGRVIGDHVPGPLGLVQPVDARNARMLETRNSMATMCCRSLPCADLQLPGTRAVCYLLHGPQVNNSPGWEP